MISQNTIQQILSRLDIIDVIGGFVKLKKGEVIIWAFALFIMSERLHLPFRLLKNYINVLVVGKAAIRLAF
jgi:hypothetical protein